MKAIVVHMPAMNTPQFTWVKSRLPNLPQPVPPIYDPEVGAKVVLHAALSASPRREYWVGGSTVKAILGQKLIPGLLDTYLGKTGYRAQQREIPDSPGSPEQRVSTGSNFTWRARAVRVEVPPIQPGSGSIETSRLDYIRVWHHWRRSLRQENADSPGNSWIAFEPCVRRAEIVANCRFVMIATI